MASSNAATAIGSARGTPNVNATSPALQTTAVSWGAILTGAAAAAALSLILLILGAGLGLSSVSPWAHDGVSATTFGVSTILWLTFTQLAASGMGGYLAGRLRTKWLEAHADEIYFRDTAHGFLAWAVASLATAALLTSVIGSVVGGSVRAGATAAGSVAAVASAGVAAAGTAMSDNGSMGYFIDSLFRKDTNASAAVSSGSGTQTGGAQQIDSASASEVARIFMNTLRTGALSAADLRYVGQLVAQRTGLTQQEAEKRVSDTYTQAQTKLREAETAAKDAADQARKASAYAAIWIFISMLIGAFIASFAATYGGRQRDL
ncbi:MAG: hypothetical protein Q8L65_00040 [Burkholderiales bacterium]|nr:hypothetical protein [Burkholderiales bacterium]